MRTNPRCAAAAALSSCLLLAGCDGVPAPASLTIPGLGTAGGNRPPVFATQSLTMLPGGALLIEASAIDLDGDGLVITYDQLAGVPLLERRSYRVGGLLSVVFEPPPDGDYVFRISASDGFFNSDIRLTRAIRAPSPPAFDPARPIGVVAAAPAFVGRYIVQITGQVFDVNGPLSFSLGAALNIEAPRFDYRGSNPLIVRLETTSDPALNTTALGALRLASAADRAGRPDDVLIVEVAGDRLHLSGPPAQAAAAGGSAGIFRPERFRGGAVVIGRVTAEFTFVGATVSGRLAAVEVSGQIVYDAQFSGVRSP